SILANRHGSVWLSILGGLDHWNNGQIKTYHIRHDKHGAKENDSPQSLFQDERGRIWVSTLGGIGYLENDRFFPVSNLPGGNTLAIIQERAGNLFIANETHGLYRVSPQNEIEQIPWARLGHQDHASVLASDRTQGVWIGFFLGGIAHFADGKIRATYTA